MPAVAKGSREKLTVVFSEGPGAEKPPKRYRRPFVGCTVKTALAEIEAEVNKREKEGDYSMDHTWAPFQVRRNGKLRTVDRESGVVLREGDILIIDP